MLSYLNLNTFTTIKLDVLSLLHPDYKDILKNLERNFLEENQGGKFLVDQEKYIDSIRRNELDNVVERCLWKIQGTDGVRAVTSEELETGLKSMQLLREENKISSGFVKRYVWAFLALYSLKNDSRTIVVAEDGRDYATGIGLYRSLVEACTESGFNVVDLGIVPTPFLAWYSAENAIPGIMLTASHNPKEYNGVKIFVCGRKLYPFGCLGEYALSYYLVEGIRKTSSSMGNVDEVYGSDYAIDVFRYLIPMYNLEYKSQSVMMDAANGAFSVIAETVLKSLGFNVLTIAEGHGKDINDHCGVGSIEHCSTFPDDEEIRSFRTLAKMKEMGEKCGQDRMYGIVVDGDGDRAYLLVYDNMAGKMTVLNGDNIALMFVEFFKDRLALFTNTVESDFGISKVITEKYDWRYSMTCVGDRWLSKNHEKFFVGSEKSGHVLFPIRTRVGGRTVSSGNGLLSALVAIKVLEGNPDFVFRIPCHSLVYSLKNINKSIFFRNSDTWNQIRRDLETAYPELEFKENVFRDEFNMMHFSILDGKKNIGFIYFRLSGTEPKVLVSITTEIDFADICNQVFGFARTLIDKIF